MQFSGYALYSGRRGEYFFFLRPLPPLYISIASLLFLFRVPPNNLSLLNQVTLRVEKEYLSMLWKRKQQILFTHSRSPFFLFPSVIFLAFIPFPDSFQLSFCRHHWGYDACLFFPELALIRVVSALSGFAAASPSSLIVPRKPSGRLNWLPNRCSSLHSLSVILIGSPADVDLSWPKRNSSIAI